MKRGRVGLRLMAIFFALLALSAFREAFAAFLPSEDDPLALVILQVAVGTAAVVAAVGSWRGARWSPWAAVAYGVIAGGMIASLGWVLGLPAEDQPGLLVGGASALAISLACAWYLRRATTRPDPVSS